MDEDSDPDDKDDQSQHILPTKEIDDELAVYQAMLDARCQFRSSPAYEFFQKPLVVRHNGGIAHAFQCLKCSHVVFRMQDALDSSSTGNLTSHIKKCSGKEELAAAAAAYKLHEKYSSKPFTNAQMRWIAQDVRPVNIVQDGGFLRVMRAGRKTLWIPVLSTVAYSPDEDIEIEQAVDEQDDDEDLMQLLDPIVEEDGEGDGKVDGSSQEELERISKLLGKIPRDVETRWNSTFKLLCFALIYRSAVDCMAERNCELHNLQINGTDWEILEQLKERLQVIDEATRFFSRTDFAGISYVARWLDALSIHLEDFIDGNAPNALRAAAVFNPSIKTRFYEHRPEQFSPEWITRVKQRTAAVFNNEYMAELQQLQHQRPSVAKPKTFSEQIFQTSPVKSAGTAHRRRGAQPQALATELDVYLSSEPENTTDFIEWWYTHCEQQQDPNPLIAAAARAWAGKALKRKRKRTEALKLTDENDPPAQVSQRAAKKLHLDLDSERARNSVLSERTDVLEQQRNNQYVTVSRLRKAAQAETVAHNAEVATLRARISELESLLVTVEGTITTLRADLCASEKRLSYSVASRDRFCAREVKKAVKQATTFRLKSSGFYTNPVRTLVAELVSIGRVGTRHIDFVIRSVAECAGLTVLPTRGMSPRTVGRCTREGGLASKLQVACKLNDPNVTGICLSGDGTTYRNLDVMGRHITVTANGAGETLCLGVTRSVDHAAETTFREWLEEFRDIEQVYNDILTPSEMEEVRDFCSDTVWSNINAMASDHAADQVSVADKVQDHWMIVGFAARGIRAMREMPPTERDRLLSAEKQRAVQSAGGVEAWLRLPAVRRQEIERELLHSLHVCLGEAEFNKLTPAQQNFIRFFVRSGCCMHKDLNAVVYGNKRMMASWAEAGLPGPIKMHNRDNAEAAKSGESAASARADEVSQAGTVKVAWLFGTLFNSSEDKKGYVDLFRIFLQTKYTVCPWIPDTQACRFQSNYEMARFILHYRADCIVFLTQQRLGKKDRKFNNLEQNVWNALYDGPTLSELAALAFYGTAIGRPYMSEVRATGLVDMMNLGPLHLDVIAQCDIISQCPEILCMPADSDGALPGSLYGLPFDDTKLLAVLDDLQKQGLLPHLEVPFLPGGSIASATAGQRARLVIPATNDACESLVGAWGAEKRRAPTTRVPFFNSKTMFRRNGTSPFLKGLLPGAHARLRRLQRHLDALGLSKLEDMRQMEHSRKKQKEGKDAEARAEARLTAQREKLDAISPTRFLSLGAMLDYGARATLTGKIINANIFWHRHRGQPNVQRKLKKTRPGPSNVDEKYALLHAVLSYDFAPTADGSIDDPFDFTPLSDGPRRSRKSLQKFQT
ncbi:hypothetical protein AURDEDRAFT_130393 [Auricularia subglabra TFB-10046 SS5]|nr:hypothetical protein AURDEDRAFT_130393 [Auricularia subglabra TFB-10046 SS5]